MQGLQKQLFLGKLKASQVPPWNQLVADRRAVGFLGGPFEAVKLRLGLHENLEHTADAQARPSALTLAEPRHQPDSGDHHDVEEDVKRRIHIWCSRAPDSTR